MQAGPLPAQAVFGVSPPVTGPHPEGEPPLHISCDRLEWSILLHVRLPGAKTGKILNNRSLHNGFTLQHARLAPGRRPLRWIIASHQKRLDRRDEEERRKANDELEKMREQRRKATEAEISEIKASLKELSKSLKAHADADKADVILNELKNISGEQSTQSAMITNISGEVKQLLVADGVRKEKIDSLERYIKGVDTSLRNTNATIRAENKGEQHG